MGFRTAIADLPKFSLRSLLIWVTFVALCVAAMKHPSYWWIAVSNLVVTALAGVSVARAVVSTGRNRAFWMTYCVSLFVYWQCFGLWLDTSFEPRMIWWFFHKHQPLNYGFENEIVFDYGSSISEATFNGFILVLHLLIAVHFSTVVSWACYFLVRDKRA